MVILNNWELLLKRCEQYCLKCPCESSKHDVENLINAMYMSLLEYKQDLEKLKIKDNSNE